MLSFERRNAICELVEKQGRADISELVKLFDVSAETIRKDLILLEKNKQLRRVHGGVIPYSRSVARLTLTARLDHCRDKKRELCEYACRFIENGDWIFLDAGSTTSEFIELLADRFTELHIVTYYLPVVKRLGHLKGFDIMLCGGRYNCEEEMFCGELTVQALDRLHVDKAFVCPSAVSLKNGMMCCHYEYIDVMRKGIDICDQLFVLADSEKIEAAGNFKLGELTGTVITDSALSDDIFDLYTQKDITIVRS